MGNKKYVLVKDGKKVSREIKDLGLPMHVSFFKKTETLFNLAVKSAPLKKRKTFWVVS